MGLQGPINGKDSNELGVGLKKNLDQKKSEAYYQGKINFKGPSPGKKMQKATPQKKYINVGIQTHFCNKVLAYLASGIKQGISAHMCTVTIALCAST